MRFLLISLLTSALLITGCASPYKKEGFAGGFSETQLGENIWKVSFRGNGYTSGERAADLALLRSAELTLNNGFSYFALVDSKSANKVSVYQGDTTTTTRGKVDAYGNVDATSTTSGGNLYFINKPRSTNLIMMFKDKKEAQGFAFDAQFICNSIGSKYDILCSDH